MNKIALEHIHRFYPGVHALEDVSFEIKKGEVHCIIGENGAGKSTLMKILAGSEKVTSGNIRIDGALVNFKTPEEAIKGGIGIVYQELSNFFHLDVASNIFANQLPKNKGLIDYHLLYKNARDRLDACGLNYINEKSLMRDISLGAQQMVEIASIMAKDAKVVILDEPTSALTDVEINKLNDLIKGMKNIGITVIYISHKLDEILYLADTITVLKDGKHVVTLPNDGNLDKESLVRYMVGRNVEYDYKVGSNTIGEVLLEVKDLSSGNSLKDISFHLHRGEILGIAGLEGSGRTELLEAIFGWRRIQAGHLMLNGEAIHNNSPQEAIKNGFAYITKERKSLGLFLNLDISDNTCAASTEKYRKNGLVDFEAMKNNAKKYVSLMQTKVADLDQKVLNLSGGNQQKVLLSMWLSTEPEIFLIDEPTRGIDVGAKAEIHMLLRKIVSEGKGVLMVSSEMPEIMASCDRVIVMSEGEITGTLTNKELTEEKMMHFASINTRDLGSQK